MTQETTGVLGAGSAVAVAAALVDLSTPFSVEPYPDDLWVFTHHNEARINAAIQAAAIPVATEQEFLEFFYGESDFGPADSDVRQMIKRKFESTTGKRVPAGYRTE